MTDFATPTTDAATPATPVTTGEGVIDALRRQVVLYEQISSLAGRQSELVESGQTEELLSLLGDRQRLIAGLTAINAQLEPVRAEWSVFAASLSDSQRSAVASLASRIDQLRQSILKQDDQDRAALSAARDRVGRDLRKLSQTGQAARAYQSGRMVGSESNAASTSTVAAGDESTPGYPGSQASMPVSSRFTDRKG